MSITFNIEKLSPNNREKINKDLEIKIENKFGIGMPRYIYAFIIRNDIFL